MSDDKTLLEDLNDKFGDALGLGGPTPSSTQRPASSTEGPLVLGSEVPSGGPPSTTPPDSPIVQFYKARYLPAYGLADGIQSTGTVFAWLCVIPALGSCAAGADENGSDAGILFIAGVTFLVFAMAMYGAALVAAAMVRAFLDIAVGIAPGLSDADRAGILGAPPTQEGT